MSTKKEQIEYLISLKDKVTNRLSRTATNCGFRQQMSQIDKINTEILKLTRDKKDARN